MLVSIVIPVFNGAEFVRDAIDSALMQTYSPIEVIVVDDGSTDGTWELLQDYQREARLQLLRHPDGGNHGVGMTRAAALKRATGDFVAFLDADDLYRPDKIAAQMKAMAQQRDAVLCHTAVDLLTEIADCRRVDRNFCLSSEERVYHYAEESDYLHANHICNSTVLVRAAALRSCHIAVPQIFQFEDWLTWVLLSTRGAFVYLPQKTVSYRYHEESSTHKVANNRLKLLYSYVEFYICVAAFGPDSETRERATALLIQKLKQLALLYQGSLSTVDAFEHASTAVPDDLPLAALNGQCAELERQCYALDRENRALERDLHAITSSKLWDVASRIWRLRSALRGQLRWGFHRPGIVPPPADNRKAVNRTTDEDTASQLPRSGGRCGEGRA